MQQRRAFLDLLLESVSNGAKLSGLDIRTEVDTFMFAVFSVIGPLSFLFLFRDLRV